MKITVKIEDAKAMEMLKKELPEVAIKKTDYPEKGCMACDVSASNLAATMTKMAKVPGVKIMVCE